MRVCAAELGEPLDEVLKAGCLQWDLRVVAGSVDTRGVALLCCRSHLNQSEWFAQVADAVVNVVWRVKLGQDLQEILEHFQ